MSLAFTFATAMAHRASARSPSFGKSLLLFLIIETVFKASSMEPTPAWAMAINLTALVLFISLTAFWASSARRNRLWAVGSSFAFAATTAASRSAENFAQGSFNSSFSNSRRIVSFAESPFPTENCALAVSQKARARSKSSFTSAAASRARVNSSAARAASPDLL
jgi:hypothetical protein